MHYAVNELSNIETQTISATINERKTWNEEKICILYKPNSSQYIQQPTTYHRVSIESDGLYRTKCIFYPHLFMQQNYFLMSLLIFEIKWTNIAQSFPGSS